MKRFFIKKYIFAACFFILLFGFCSANVLFGAAVPNELLKELTQIKAPSELKALTQKAEQLSCDNILGGDYFTEAYGYLQRLLGKREYNRFSFVRDKNGMIYYGSTSQGQTADLQDCADNVRRLNEYVEGRGAHLLVVVPPAKLLAGKSQAEDFLPINDPNRRIDALLDMLHEYRVATADLRVGLSSSPYTQEQLFFKTCHKWTPLAAFCGTTQIVAAVRERFGDDWDPDRFYCDLGNYKSFTYPQSLLGSSGRITGALYSGLDDFTMLYPDFETDFTWSDIARNEARSGSFTESLMDSRSLKAADRFAPLDELYLHEISAHDRIINHNAPEKPKLTVLRDSYFSPVACFLAPMCSEIDMAWVRRTRSDMDIESFVKESDFDYLILEVYPYNLDENSFDFFNEQPTQGGDMP